MTTESQSPQVPLDPTEVKAALADPAQPNPEGRRLGDFRLIREVGRGGMGVVFEACQVSLNRRVAVKILPSAAACDPRRLRRFGLEAQAAASLQHPHIVPILTVGDEEGVPYYAMPFIEGRDLGRILRGHRRPEGPTTNLDDDPEPTPPDGPRLWGLASPSTWADDPSAELPMTAEPEPGRSADEPLTDWDPAMASGRGLETFREVARLGRQAADALAHAHEVGIVHRDIKPANLLVDRRGHLWVTDFGLARLQAEGDLTATGDLVGTLRYMSPEQLRGGRTPADHRTDVYALGATLYELATLEPAFPETDRSELLRKILHESPRPPRQVCPSVPRDLERVILKAMAREPSDRYVSAGELADDLGRFLDGEPVRARPVGPLGRLGHWATQPRRVRDAGWFVVVYGYLYLFRSSLGLALVASGMAPAPPRPWEFYRDVAGTALLDTLPTAWVAWQMMRGRRWAIGVGLVLAVHRIILQGLILSGRVLKYGGFFDDPAVRMSTFLVNLGISTLVLGAFLVALAADRRNHAPILMDTTGPDSNP